jgi:ParB/RepB/Spo0J family partition protein
MRDINKHSEDVLGTNLYDSSSEPDTTARYKAKWKVLAGRGSVSVDPDVCGIWSGNTREVGTLAGTPNFEELRASIASLGQQIPAVARISSMDSSRLEIIVGASRLTAIRAINEEGGDPPLQLIVEIRTLTDEEATRLVDAENSGRSKFSAIEKARFCRAAIDNVYGTEAAFAEGFGVHKSNVNRMLDILRLPAELMDLIKDHHQISAAQADGFMKDWDEPALQPTLVRAIADFGHDKATAAAVFKTMRDAVAPPAQTRELDVLVEEKRIGNLKRCPKGTIVIKLGADAGKLGTRRIHQAIGEALANLKQARA